MSDVFTYLNNLTISLPKARNINAKMRTIPTICATYRNFSLGFLRVMISYNVKRICPPSRAGIGMRFITPNITESRARMFMKLYQFHVDGKI